MSKIVCVLYDDPVDGYPKSYPRDDIPKFDHYPDGQTRPTPKAIDFKPGELLGSVSGELGSAQVPRIRRVTPWSSRPTRTVPTPLSSGTTRHRDRHLAAVLAGVLTAERIATRAKAQARVTAGIGSDHIDLQAAIDRGITVAEVTFLQQHQRGRARGDDDPCRTSEITPLASVGREGRLEHRGLRRACLRREGMAWGPWPPAG